MTSILSQLSFFRFAATRGVLALAAALVLIVWSVPTYAAAAPNPTTTQVEAHGKSDAHGDNHAEGEHHGLPAHAPQIGGAPGSKGSGITNSMVAVLLATVLIVAFVQIATRNMKEVPDGKQNFVEWLVESLMNFLDGIMGHSLAKKTFWFFATAFIFILATNWLGLLPGVGTIGWGTPNAQGGLTHIARPILRGANADLNMTLAMSSIFFAAWIFWALKANGLGGFLAHIFAPKGKMPNPAMQIGMIVIFFAVGILEVVSIMFRPVSLSFRLYGNIFAGENMLESMMAVAPAFAWLTPLPFYFMELMVGVVQALVFMLLTSVFTLLICSHGDEHGEHH